MINNKIEVVPNGVNINQFKPLDKEKQRKWVENYFHTDFSSDLNIVSVGRLSPEKGLRYLIESLKYLNLTSKLFIVGEGPEKNSLKKLVETRGLDFDRCYFCLFSLLW